jgi:hypothetical protein
MACFSNVLLQPEPHGHFVQLHDGDATLLSRNVARYISEGLKRGEGGLVIATPEHRAAFEIPFAEFGVDTQQAVRDSKLIMLDARETLGEFMIDGRPDADRFSARVDACILSLRGAGVTGLRAYGEMVGVLWTEGQYTAAIQLEEFWNRLLDRGGFSLFCSYPIDIFGPDFRISGVDALLCDHTHLIPTGSDEALESALDRAMDQHLGTRSYGLKSLIKANYRPSWAILPRAEGTILWLRNNLPHEADDILNLARQYYRSSASGVTSSQ